MILMFFYILQIVCKGSLNQKEILFQKHLGKILNSLLGKHCEFNFFFGRLCILRNKKTKERQEIWNFIIFTREKPFLYTPVKNLY